jgi:hypothetical protein
VATTAISNIPVVQLKSESLKKRTSHLPKLRSIWRKKGAAEHSRRQLELEPAALKHMLLRQANCPALITTLGGQDAKYCCTASSKSQ